MRAHDDPDRDYERRTQARDEQLERELALERLEEYTPAEPIVDPGNSPDVPRITTPMVTLAWTVLNGSDHDRRDAARVLAELVLEAS